MMKLKLSREQKEAAVQAVQHYFEMERGEEIGSLAAESLIEYMVEVLGPHLYNEAVKDARTVVAERMAAIEDELYALEKPQPRLGR